MGCDVKPSRSHSRENDRPRRLTSGLLSIEKALGVSVSVN